MLLELGGLVVWEKVYCGCKTSVRAVLSVWSVFGTLFNCSGCRFFLGGLGFYVWTTVWEDEDYGVISLSLYYYHCMIIDCRNGDVESNGVIVTCQHQHKVQVTQQMTSCPNWKRVVASPCLHRWSRAFFLFLALLQCFNGRAS